MQHAHLVENLEHVEVAVGVELVSRVVTGQSSGNAGRTQLMQEGDAPPPRGAAAAGISLLHTATRTYVSTAQLVP